MAQPILYPPSPANVPANLTAPTPAYRRETAFTLISVILFFLVYFGAIAGCICFFVWCVGTFLLIFFHRGFACLTFVQLLMAAPMLALLLVLVKNLFQWGGKEKNARIEIFAHEHPRLFSFIDRVCEETGAPYPRRVFVDAAVNAAAFNDGNVLWQLFFPARKNLLIGLGLVNVINLTEFKALLAHEFGHFSQKSMQLGAFVYTARNIIDGMVNGRDGLDELTDPENKEDIVSWLIAWIPYGIIMGLRSVLRGLRFVMFYFHQEMSRQMEFNADLVAVSLTGSDAPVHLLCRSAFGNRCLGQTIEDMEIAMDHDLYTADMFFHQSRAVDFVRRHERNPRLGEPPALPQDTTQTTRVFDPDDDNDQADMWSDHPPNHLRERNAKAFYIRTEFDERSPWALFDDVETLRADVTRKFYRMQWNARDFALAKPQRIQALIDEDRAETTYDPAYQGLYDQRDLAIEDVFELTQEAQRSPWSIPQLAAVRAGLYGVEIKHRGQLHNHRLQEYRLLLDFSRGWRSPSNGSFEFRGELRDLSEAKRLLRKVEEEIEADLVWLRDCDRQVFLTHYQMALQVSEYSAHELYQRYQFHRNMQYIHRIICREDGPIRDALAFVASNRSHKLPPEVFDAQLAIFFNAHQGLRDALKHTEDIKVPALKNMVPGEPLRPLLLRNKLVHGVSRYDGYMSKKWIARLAEQMREMERKVRRIHYKSLGGILALQERIAQEWQEWSKLPVLGDLVMEAQQDRQAPPLDESGRDQETGSEPLDHWNTR